MNFRKVSLYLLCLTIGVLSCKKDDDPTIVAVEIRDRAVQQLADMDSIHKYLDTHYYNSEDFGSSNENPSLSDIEIFKLVDGASVPDGHTLLRTAVGNAKTITYREVIYEFYVLKLNQGGGAASPTFADNVRVNYSGFTLEDAVFDETVNPVILDLTTLVPGWRKVLPDFNVAESFADNPDGTVNFLNKGLGIMFLPSGLAYFSSPSGIITAYSPIIFKFELLQMSENDHDGDGIPSYLEDLNGDGEYTVNYEDLSDTSDDDSDGDGTPDYADTDDDNDGISTINEDINNDGDPRNDDSNGNGIPNYLDATDTIRKVTT
ncbi:FKBP-type peptidyl-prolyl cis-trans isomerase [Mariniflexile sp. AS56]|uniref:FKBP-type peptidyl-prolyl cis-trans isomerase n=1 Tax=Mariniflexile sp. AS56 TaxID=3063957 RepID=UPI0026F04EBD|nr:hypothetical protein [Mariniflexile sp. AS56]MDO7171677.1 hypothetical protein [Mariniflexile sp. AS56]